MNEQWMRHNGKSFFHLFFRHLFLKHENNLAFMFIIRKMKKNHWAIDLLFAGSACSGI